MQELLCFQSSHPPIRWQRATLAEGSATFEAMASYQDHEEDHHDDDGEADGQPNLLGAVPFPRRA